MTKRAVLYARVSGDDRGRDGRNLAGQLEMCRDYALDKGWQVVAELAEDDRGASGAAFELPELTRVRDMAQAHEFDVLITRELDRLSRRLAKQLFVEEELKHQGVEITYVLGEYADTAEGSLMKNIKASVAEYERLKVTERMVRGRNLKVKAGSVLVQQRPPYGYTVIERDRKWVLEINEDEAQVVRMVFDWYTVGDGTDGPMSLRRIQRKLSEMKVPTLVDLRNPGVKKRGQGEWSQGSVYRMLTNETYVGTWHFGKSAEHRELIAVSVPALISPETWVAAQTRRSQNKAKSERNLKYEYLVGRRVHCGKCGATMNGDSALRGKPKPYFYYRCAATGPSNTDYAHTCDMPGFRVSLVDAKVWEWLRDLLTDSAALEKGLAALRNQEEHTKSPIRERIAYIDSQVADKQTQVDRLLDAYQAGGMLMERLIERSAKLEAAIAEHNKDRAGLAAQLEVPTLTDEQIKDLQAFTARIAVGLPNSEQEFQFRRFVVDTLNVEATLVLQDGQKFVDIRCDLGTDKVHFPVVSTSSRARSRHNSHTDIRADSNWGKLEIEHVTWARPRHVCQQCGTPLTNCRSDRRFCDTCQTARIRERTKKRGDNRKESSN